MSDQKAFAQFPAAGGAAYHLIDIFMIEAIGQSSAPEGAVIFGATDRYYSVEVSQEELDRAGEPDAASWCLSLVTEVSQRHANAAVIYADDVPMNDEDDPFGK